MHVITVSWDLQYLTCLAESSRAKLKAVEVSDMNSGTTVSQPGNLFYDTLKVSCGKGAFTNYVDRKTYIPPWYMVYELFGCILVKICVKNPPIL